MRVITVPVQHLRSDVADAVPLVSQVLEGQLVINFPDQKIYTLDPSGNIISLGTAPGDLSVVAITGSYNDLLDKPVLPGEYVLPPASSVVLGGVKPQTGLTVDGDGVLTADVVSVNGQTGVIVLTGADLNIPDLLGVDGKILATYLPDSITGGLNFQGFWNATTNTPTIPAAAPGNTGHYYIVETAGTTTIDGISTWEIGDYVLSDGVAWGRILAPVGGVVSVNGNTGVVTVNAANLPGLATVGQTGNYSDLIGIPVAFTPSAHTHLVASITDIAAVAVSNDYNDLSNLPPDTTVAQIGVSISGDPAILQDEEWVFTRDVQFGDDFVGSAAKFTLAAGTSATFNILKNGVLVGTVTYDSITGVAFTSVGPVTVFGNGDALAYHPVTTNVSKLAVTLRGNYT